MWCFFVLQLPVYVCFISLTHLTSACKRIIHNTVCDGEQVAKILQICRTILVTRECELHSLPIDQQCLHCNSVNSQLDNTYFFSLPVCLSVTGYKEISKMIPCVFLVLQFFCLYLNGNAVRGVINKSHFT